MRDADTTTAKLLRSTGVVSAMTVISRVLGMARDMVFTRFFGADWMMDAFIIANRIPNMLRRFFAEGAFAQAFVPVLGEARQQGGDAAVRELSDVVAGTLGVCLFVLTLIGVIAAPILVAGFAPGFLDDDRTFDLTTIMLRFTFPYLGFISLTAMAAGLLNTYGRFAVPALTPVILNICLIASAVWLSPRFEQPTFALALAVLVAGVLQLGFQLPFLARLRLLPRPRWGWQDSRVRKVMALMLPAIFGSSIVQINLVIDNAIASFLGEGRPTWLYFSDRLMEFPLGVFGIALATVILPSLSRSHAGENPQQFSATLDWSLRLVWLIALPAAVGLGLLAGPLVVTLFYGGQFDLTDAMMTRASLWAFAGGLLAFVMIKILAPGFFSRQDTTTPVRFALVALFVNLLMNVVLVTLFMHYQVAATHAALALATTISAFVNAALLTRRLRGDGVLQMSPGWTLFLFRVLLACVFLATFLYALAPPLGWWISSGVGRRVIALCGLILGGAVLYFLVLFVSGLRPSDLRMRGTAREENQARVV